VVGAASAAVAIAMVASGGDVVSAEADFGDRGRLAPKPLHQLVHRCKGCDLD
jgi:hypothetical protein